MENTFDKLMSNLPTKIIYQNSQYLFHLECDHNFNWTAGYRRERGNCRLFRTVEDDLIRVLEVLHLKLANLPQDYELVY